MEDQIVEIPVEYFPKGVGPGSFDPRTLRLAAEAHCRHPFDHDMEVKAWVVLYLLDSWNKIADQGPEAGIKSPHSDRPQSQAEALIEGAIRIAEDETDRAQQFLIEAIENEKRAHTSVEYHKNGVNQAVAKRQELEASLRRLRGE